MKKFIKKTIAGLIAGVMAVSSMPFTALAADEIPEITGAIKYSSVIFTHGTNTVSTDYNFMMRGTQIASGDVKSATDCKTTVSVANGVTINSVSCVEDSNAQLSVSNNVLTGNFGSNHDDSTVTLKTNVTYNGKSYVSYNKVYVDTIPVPAHAASISQRYYGVFNPLKIIMAYSQTLKGSLGEASSNGSSDSNSVSANAKELFVPGTQVRYDNKNDTNHWRLTNNISIDKVAGQTGYKNSGGSGVGTTTLTTTAPTGYYYFDKSTTDNYGFSAQNGSSFTFDLVTIPFNIVTGDNASGGNVDLNTHNLTGANFTQTDPYSTFSYDSGTGVPSTKIFTNKITGDASSITNGTMTGSYELRFANGSNNVWGVNITKSNWNVYVADKSAARNPYNLANSEIKTSDSYTADSWNAYRTAYLEDEEFLSNYKNVTLDNVQTTASEKGTKLTTAYNNLVAKVVYSFVNFKGDIVSTVEASSVEEALKSAPANSKTSYKSNGSENHTVTTYSWPNSSTSTTIKEVATDKVEAHDFSSGTCVCGAIALQTQEYDTALAQAKAEAKNPNGRYTTDSIDTLKAEITAVEAERVYVTTQAQLEELTKRLLTAISNLVQAKFNVVFVTVGLDSTTEDEKFNDYIEYGETYNADALANVKKWVVTTDNGNTSTVIDNFDQKASFVITKDAKIYAYLSGEDSSKTSSKVTFLGRHNQVVAIRYVAEGKTLDTTTVDAPSIPFYKFENWDVASVMGDGNEYTVKASYTCNQASSDFCTVHFGDWSKPYAYDSYVYLPNTVAGTKYALYSDEQCTKLLTVLDGVDFYAPKTSNIYVKAYDTEATASIAVTGSFAEKDVEAGKNYANFNCKFYLPAGANAIEWGVEVLSPDGTRTAKVKAEKLSERNEYTVRFGTEFGSKVTSIKGRAYLVYVQDGVKTTIYSSDEYVTVNLNA
ncbi:hypothetical protein [uncultured Eubacterium sp.]|uniref:hypothetical protein n=1 Tax=uncultured Eubacterium sp. TaxID=165185 RepID=UPI0028043B3A|nr:hypothetical protein [uncultured Eubacterium sp.]